MKILLFDGTFKTTTFINRLAEGLAEKDEVFIAGFNEDLDKPVQGVKYITIGSNQNNIRFAWTSLKLAAGKGISTLFNTVFQLLKGNKDLLRHRNLEIVLDKIQPDVIHLQWTSVLPYFEKVLENQKIPVILSQRGFHTNVKPFVYPDNMEYLRKLYPKIAAFHSVSQAISRNGDKIWNGENKTDKVVYSGLPLDEWEFNENYQRKTPLNILSVGRSHWKKGYDYALHALHFLSKKEVEFSYTIIGAQEDEEVLFLIDSLGLKDKVTLIDKLPLPEVRRYMRESDLLLLPSIEEGLPNVAIEAMAVGLPVVAFDVGGIPELIDSGKEGFLVPSRDVQAMAEAIFAFTQMPSEELEKLRKAARRKVEIQHDAVKMVEEMRRVYGVGNRN